MENQKKNLKPIMVEVSEGLEGIQLIFRLKKGGRTIDFGTVRSYETTEDGVLLKFDPNKPGLVKSKVSLRKEQ